MHDFTDDNDDDKDKGSGPSGAGPASPPVSAPALPGGLSAIISGGGGASGSGGVTDELINYNERFAASSPALYRDKVVDRTVAALISRDKPNALLVGPAGVGKTKVVEEIARRIAVSHPSIPERLADKVVYELPLSSLLAGASMMGEMEQRVKMVIEFATDPANKAVLFIDEIHQIISDDASSTPYERIAQQLKPALARGDLHVIGATTDQESRRIYNDPAFARRFSRVGVSELNLEQTREILDVALPGLLKHYRRKVSVSSEVLDAVGPIADEHLSSLHRPDNALTLLDKAMARSTVELHQLVANKVLPTTHVMPLSAAMLADVAETMHGSDAVPTGFDAVRLRRSLDRIVGQDEVCDRVVKLLRRDRMRMFKRNKPLTWLFAGTSGVGKTEVARVVAREVLGTEPIVLNMSEYSREFSASSIIGSPPGYVGSSSNKEMPFDSLDANPRQIVVLDEFEKAHREIQRLFLSVLDTGELRMASGKTVDFSKAVIIATTNAGRDSIAKGGLSMGFGTGGQTAASSMDREALTKAMGSSFEPEMLGRFSWIVAFNGIDRTTYATIVEEAYDRVRAEAMEVNSMLAGSLPMGLSEDQVEQIVAESYAPSQGARPAEPAVREFVADLLDPL